MSEKHGKKISEEEKEEWLQIEMLTLVCGDSVQGTLNAQVHVHVECEMRDVIYSHEQRMYIFLCHLPKYNQTVYVKVDGRCPVVHEDFWMTVEMVQHEGIWGDCPALAADIRKAVESITLFGLGDFE